MFYPIPVAFAAVAAREHVTVSAGDPPQLAELLAAADSADGADARRGADARAGGVARDPLEVELEVETGFGRGGFAPEALAAAAQEVTGARHARLAGLWTHLQASEDPDRTRAQLDRFDAATALLRAAGLPVPPRHVAASGGLFTGVASLDGVRPGLAVYGHVADELAGQKLPADVSTAIDAL